MVFEAYSAYVNNFSHALETSKKQARSRPAFAEFLKQRFAAAPDKLSLFGLMVKPVQRFPQFIMVLMAANVRTLKPELEVTDRWSQDLQLVVPANVWSKEPELVVLVSQDMAKKVMIFLHTGING